MAESTSTEDVATISTCNGDNTFELASASRYSYSTIGMGDDVFVAPPPSNTSCEIRGTYKNRPEDFIVREIACRSRTPDFPLQDVVADLSESKAMNEEKNQKKSSMSVSAHGIQDGFIRSTIGDSTNQCGRQSKTENGGSESFCARNETSAAMQKDGSSEMKPSDVKVSVEPDDVVRRILESVEQNAAAAQEMWDSINHLHQEIIERVRSGNIASTKNTASRCIWIHPIPAEASCVISSDNTNTARGGNRGEFHRALKVAFPLLQSETIVRTNDADPIPGFVNSDKHRNSQPWIRISEDDTFFGLIPNLHAPEVDLLQLYRFRNTGCTPDGHNHTSRKKRGRGRKRGRDIRIAPSESNQVVLRLRPDMSRPERAPVHHLIAKQCRDFVTSTFSRYPLSTDDDDNVDSCPTETAAIVVQWSPRAQRKAQSRTNVSHHIENTFCVLQKTQVEHLAAIQHLCAALRCRPSDVGLAGIKDKFAETYQFCTLRQVPIDRARRANGYLQQRGMKIGLLHSVPYFLNQGDLVGNRFEIVVHDLKRVVKVEQDNDEVTETCVPCEKQHIQAMVDRIRAHGFVNFYGEQRLGMPGPASVVGVRAFDIGRAMLQQDFSKSIDLLLQGRGAGMDGQEESPELRHARQVWIQSGRDASETLKAWPKGESMSRERLVLQGVKRYGQSDPLSAIRCLPFSVRTFWINAYQSYVWNTMATERIRRFGTKVVRGDLYVREGVDGEIAVADEAVTASIELDRVVLPLPGYNTRYPENAIADLYRAWLACENVSFSRDSPPEATAKGSYRRLVARVDNVKVLPLGDNATKMTESMTLQFDLPSGSYATVLLRELMLTTDGRQE